jgi:flagellar motor component MotA
MITKLCTLVGFVVLAFFVKMASGETISLFNPLAVLFMIGGSLFCLSLNMNPILFCKIIWNGLTRMGGKHYDKIEKVIDRLNLFSRDFYSSSDNLERNIYLESNEFMGIALVKAREGLLSGDELEDVLSRKSQFQFEKRQDQIDNIANFLKYPAIMGLLGSLFGLVSYMNSTEVLHPYLGSPGEIMEFSVLVTIYGFAFSYLIMQPLIEKLEIQNQSEFLTNKIIVEAVVMMRNRMNPLIISEILGNYTERKTQTSEETWKQAI